jgi:hypothetical protein
MQIRTTLPQYANAELNLPEVGATKFIDGVAEVPDHIGALLLGQPNDWEEVLIEEAEQVEEMSTEDEQALSESIDQMSLDELVALAKESKLVGYNAFLKNEAKMKSYLKKKLLTATN